MGQFPILTGVAVFLLGTGAALAENTGCADEYARRLAADMMLTYEQFDQTQESGFRRLAKMSCWKEAADLIEAYIDSTGAEEHSLVWHIAQMRAAQGDYPAAIAYARRSLRPAEDFIDRPLRWNDYVLGVIAFLERDKGALITHRDKVAEGIDEYYGNEMNRNALDALIANFDESYADANSRARNTK